MDNSTIKKYIKSIQSDYLYQQGGATRQDSLNVYNSAVNFKNKINKLKYEKIPSVYGSDEFTKKNNLYIFKDGKITINKNIEDKEELVDNSTTRKNGDVYLNSDVALKGNQKSFFSKPIGDNHPILKKVNNNQYETTEQSSFLGYNTKLPTILMDGRIIPQKTNMYNLDENKINNTDGDFVVFNEYDPLAVKPFGLLTDKEKAERVRKYGRSGVPDSYGQTKPPITPLQRTQRPSTNTTPPKNNIQRDTQGNLVDYGNSAPTGRPQLVKMIEPAKETPQVQGLQSLNLQGITQQSNPILANLPTFTPQAQTPTSYNIQEQDMRMNNGRGYYNDVNYTNADIDTALRAQAQADAYNAEIERKYNNPQAQQNPKAQERYNTLRNNVTVTPQYQKGGVINYSQDELNFLEFLKNNQK